MCSHVCSSLTHMLLTCLTGDRGDERHLIIIRVHVLVPWHHQREGQRRAEDLLRSHGDDPILVPGDRDALSAPRRPNKQGSRTQSHNQSGRRRDSSCSSTKTHYQKPAEVRIDDCREAVFVLSNTM